MAGNSVKSHVSVIKKIEQDKQIVYAEVYAPFTLDAYGDMMLPEDIEAMAHGYLQRKDLDETIDVNHDNVPTGSYPVESYIAKKGDPIFTEGAWVLGVKIVDEHIWDKVKKGVITGFSMESLAKLYPAVVEVEVVGSVLRKTEETDGHTHIFFVELDEGGKVKGGATSKDAGHWHKINAGTRTEESQGHRHRYSLS